MKQDAILFIDVDDSPSARYSYREPHFVEARSRGLACLVACVSGHKHVERLERDSDDVFLLDELSATAVFDLVIELGDRYKVRAIFCHAGHSSALGQVGCIVAEACQKLGLVCSRPEAILACNNKFLMRKVLQEHGIRSVPFALCNDEPELAAGAVRVGYPLIAKPAFGGASAFIKKCQNWAELRGHYTHFLSNHSEAAYADFYGCTHTLPDEGGTSRQYIPGRSILLEGYIEGVEGTLECVITEESIHPILINEKLMLTERSGTVLENLLITPPTSFTSSQCEQIRNYAVKCLHVIGLTNALVHFEFRMTQDGPVVIEINPRLGGLYVNSALRDLAELNPYQMYISLLLHDQGIANQLVAAMQKVEDGSQNYAMLAVYPKRNGYFKGFENLKYLDNNECVREYAIHDIGSYVDADIEEHYLLKCWAKVDGVEHAYALHDEVEKNLSAIIDAQLEG